MVHLIIALNETLDNDLTTFKVRLYNTIQSRIYEFDTYMREMTLGKDEDFDLPIL